MILFSSFVYLFVLSTSCLLFLQRTCMFCQPPACLFCNVPVCFINLLLICFATYLFVLSTSSFVYLFVLSTSSLIPLSLKTAQRYNIFLIYANIPVFFYSPALNTSLPRISVAVWLLWIFRYVPSCLSSSAPPVPLLSASALSPCRLPSTAFPPPFHHPFPVKVLFKP